MHVLHSLVILIQGYKHIEITETIEYLIKRKPVNRNRNISYWCEVVEITHQIPKSFLLANIPIQKC